MFYFGVGHYPLFWLWQMVTRSSCFPAASFFFFLNDYHSCSLETHSLLTSWGHSSIASLNTKRLPWHFVVVAAFWVTPVLSRWGSLRSLICLTLHGWLLPVLQALRRAICKWNEDPFVAKAFCFSHFSFLWVALQDESSCHQIRFAIFLRHRSAP